MDAATTATPPCCSGRPAGWPPTATSVEWCTSSSSLRRRAWAGRPRCSTMGCSSASRVTRSTPYTLPRGACGDDRHRHRTDHGRWRDLRCHLHGHRRPRRPGRSPDAGPDGGTGHLRHGPADDRLAERARPGDRRGQRRIRQRRAPRRAERHARRAVAGRHPALLQQGGPGPGGPTHPRARRHDRRGLRVRRNGTGDLITTPLVNARDQVDIVARAARSVLGTESVFTDMAPITGGEDFGQMLEATPGALVFLGNGTAPDGTIHNVHTPHYDFNDEAIGAGVAFWVRLVRQQLSTEAVPGGR